MSKRTDSKCNRLMYYKTRAAAQEVADRKTGAKHQAYPCQCGGFHVERIGPTTKQAEHARLEEYIGNAELVSLCRFFMNREVARLKRIGSRKRTIGEAQ